MKKGGSKQNFVHFSLPFGSGHLYTICKLSVLNNRIIISQIKVNICEINSISPKLVVAFARAPL